MATTTRIKDTFTKIGKRELTVHVFESEQEHNFGEKQVYLAIEDFQGNLLGNLNVSREELLIALNAIGLKEEN